MPTSSEEKAARKQAKSDKEAQERKDNFARQLVEARTPREYEQPKQPVAPAISAKTLAEMAKGAEVSQRHAERAAAQKALPRPAENEGGSIPVFRPSDYVPNMNQGKIKADRVG